ncbi:MAG TPA: DDE-type integrase/transposase/recombinase, partial [Candidatus Mediterraneibacter intestinigallinarum]|nr:DDE-type integrase/transposase/recombinase [Candidatus Mediterraneibacter intestinigallinarum]
MDYKKVLRLHFVNHLSCREIAESCGDCSKTTVNEFLKRFRENPELSYPLPADVTNEYIESLLYKKPGVSADQLLYRDFNKEAVYKALARKGETLKHLWQKYNAIGVVDGKKPMSYRQYCRRYSEWADSKQLTFHIQRYPGVNLELDYAGKQLYLHNRRNPKETTEVTIFIAALTYSDYFYAEGMTECDIRNWIRVNNNALSYFGGVTPTITPDNCKVAVARNKDWISPVLNKDFQAWAEHNNTVLTPAKVKSPRWKPVVEGHVKIITMHILMDMEDMVFYSLDDLNRVL